MPYAVRALPEQIVNFYVANLWRVGCTPQKSRIRVKLPKLNVAGSTPVTRSILNQ